MRRLNVTHPQISLEDFIYYYHIAHKRKNIRALNQLCHLYPELSVMAFQNDSLSKRYDPSEYDYYRWHPITLGSAYMTERRIMDMGLTKGTEVYVRKVAPLGDPLELTVRGYELSLRKEDAQWIEVE